MRLPIAGRGLAIMGGPLARGTTSRERPAGGVSA